MTLTKLLFALFLGHLIATGTSVCAQQTRIVLRKDGRVISGSRKDFLTMGVRAYRDALRNSEPPSKLAIKLSDSLSNKLTYSEIGAIVIPDGKTAGRYVIGLLIGENTLPEDFAVDENDFRYLGSYARSEPSAAIERSYNDIKRSLQSRLSPQDVESKVAELHKGASHWLGERGKEWIGLFAGYLLTELAEIPAMPKRDELIATYRAEYERSVDQTIQRGIQKGVFTWFQPVEVYGQKSVLTIGDLSNATVSRRTTETTGTAYLRIWHGRSLIVVPEKLGTEFSFETAEAVTSYVMTKNPTFGLNTVILSHKGDFGSVPPDEAKRRREIKP